MRGLVKGMRLDTDRLAHPSIPPLFRQKRQLAFNDSGLWFASMRNVCVCETFVGGIVNQIEGSYVRVKIYYEWRN